MSPPLQVGDEHLRKQHRVLADLHYSKAVRLFQLLKDAPCELLRVQLERVAFAEFQMASKSSSGFTTTAFQTTIPYLIAFVHCM